MTDSPKYLYYRNQDENKDEAVQLCIAEIFFVFVLHGTEYKDGVLMYNVMCHTVDNYTRAIFSDSKESCMNYIRGFGDIGFYPTRSLEKYYNKDIVSINDCVYYGNYPFFTDRTDYKDDPDCYNE